MTSSVKIDGKDPTIGMFGGGGVGKTSITLQYVRGEFTDTYVPTIEDDFSKLVEYNGQTLKVYIVDTAGQEDFAELRYKNYSSVHSFFFVFDVTNAKSIDELKASYNDALEATGNTSLKCIFAANKADLEKEKWQVTDEEINKLGEEYHAKVFQTSAKTNQNISEAFNELLKIMLNQDSQPKAKESKGSKDSDSKTGGCCTIF